MPSSPMTIMRPILPAAARLMPYLSTIDQSRVYSNFGPLASMLETRLAQHFGVEPDCVTTVANGTLGLTLALLTLDARPGTLCVVPAWTFIASAHAILRAGLTPYFVDVDAETWAMDPSIASAAIADAPGEVSAVMPIVPFGRPIDFAAWDRFRRETGLAVVIDAAAAFDSILPTETPAVVSLHATKSLGIGEGGFVLSTDSAVISGIHARANFGFDGSRESVFPALNAKMSEYHAAVGNAALDEWDVARSEWLAAAGLYRRLLLQTESIRPQAGFGESWVSSVCVLDVGGPDSARYEQRLRDAQIQTRRWWEFGAHVHPSTLHLPRTLVPATELLAQSTLAVPLYRDIRTSEIERVVSALDGAET
jgi:dTDP-4-amino-4,6-dideoxygalactose transaminase